MPPSRRLILPLVRALRKLDLFHREKFEKRLILLLGAKTNDMLDAGAVLPTSVKDDDLPGSRKMLHVALDIHLRLSAIGRRAG